MCYASPVMLRGRCSCAISDRPTPSSFAPPSLLRPITPLFPLHPRNAPVTPLFPLLTQKQGGGGYPLLPLHPLLPLLPLLPSAVNCKPAFLTPAVTATSIAIVGAPTFLSPAPPLSSFRLLLNLKLGIRRRMPILSEPAAADEPKDLSGHSPPKSNHSRTSAKTRGWGSSIQTCWPITLLFSSAMLTSKLSAIVGAPTFLNTSRMHLPPSAPSEVKWWHCDHQLRAARARP